MLLFFRQSFGLDLEAFRLIAGNCPEALLQLANDCCVVSTLIRWIRDRST